jgi:hypothetical protein
LTSRPDCLRIEISPPVSSPALRRRAALGGILFAAGTFAALMRLAGQWQLAARGNTSGLPAFPLLLLTLAVLFGAPLAAVGLLSLLFAEETIEVDRQELRQELAVFAKNRRRRLSREAPLALTWTVRPISPWWTWTFVRMAVVSGPERLGVGATLDVSEKKKLFEVLRRAIE